MKSLPLHAEVLMTRSDVAAALGVAKRTLDFMVAKGDYPECDLVIGRSPRWTTATYNRWIADRMLSRVEG